MEFIKAALYGVVEGITEWLPVSSTGHIILLGEFLPLDVTPEFMKLFLVVIQLGAILAVVTLFWGQLFPFSFGGGPVIRKDIFVMWFKVAVACVPAVVVEVLWGDEIDAAFYNYQTVAAALIVVGVLFLAVEHFNKNRRASVTNIAGITYRTAFLIGLFQLAAAVFPGTSRSGATILGALLLGVSRTAAAEFTFFLAVPVMFGASLYKLAKFGLAFAGPELLILAVGTAVAYFVSLAVIRFLMGYIKKHDFVPFGWYRIVLGIAVFAYFSLAA